MEGFWRSNATISLEPRDLLRPELVELINKTVHDINQELIAITGRGLPLDRYVIKP